MRGRRIRRRMWRLGGLVSSGVVGAALSLAGVAVSPGPSAFAQAAAPASGLDHVVLIMEENNGFHDVIGNPAVMPPRTRGREAAP